MVSDCLWSGCWQPHHNFVGTYFFSTFEWSFFLLKKYSHPDESKITAKIKIKVWFKTCPFVEISCGLLLPERL